MVRHSQVHKDRIFSLSVTHSFKKHSVNIFSVDDKWKIYKKKEITSVRKSICINSQYSQFYPCLHYLFQYWVRQYKIHFQYVCFNKWRKYNPKEEKERMMRQTLEKHVVYCSLYVKCHPIAAPNPESPDCVRPPETFWVLSGCHHW